jgi:hypothetical protein
MKLPSHSPLQQAIASLSATQNAKTFLSFADISKKKVAVKIQPFRFFSVDFQMQKFLRRSTRRDQKTKKQKTQFISFITVRYFFGVCISEFFRYA